MTFSEIYERSDTRRLPVDPISAARALGVKIVNYKAAAELFETNLRELYNRCPLGFSFRDNERFYIALNENSCGERRRRFTAAHELAHCVLGHSGRELTPREERAAERFAAELLAPLVVLHECGVRSAEEISRMCGISRRAAEIRLEQLIARERGGFRADDDERRVKSQFAEFIGSCTLSQSARRW